MKHGLHSVKVRLELRDEIVRTSQPGISPETRAEAVALEPAHYSARHASCRRGWLERPCAWLRAVLRYRWTGREGAASSRRLAALTTLTGEPRRLASGSGISRGSATSRCGDAWEGSRAIGSTPAQVRNRTAHMALSPYRTVNGL